MAIVEQLAQNIVSDVNTCLPILERCISTASSLVQHVLVRAMALKQELSERIGMIVLPLLIDTLVASDAAIKSAPVLPDIFTNNQASIKEGRVPEELLVPVFSKQANAIHTFALSVYHILAILSSLRTKITDPISESNPVRRSVVCHSLIITSECGPYVAVCVYNSTVIALVATNSHCSCHLCATRSTLSIPIRYHAMDDA